jgi:hypothetical protein
MPDKLRMVIAQKTIVFRNSEFIANRLFLVMQVFSPEMLLYIYMVKR